MPPILKKAEFGLSFSKTKIHDCQEVMFTAVIDADTIFYRTKDLRNNHAILTEKILKEKVETCCKIKNLFLG